MTHLQKLQNKKPTCRNYNPSAENYNPSEKTQSTVLIEEKEKK
jgi:hypothetical protein